MTGDPQPALDLRLFGDGHVARYRETSGEDGYIWNGVPILILTTSRRNGEPRDVPLIFGTADDRLVVVASKGGAPEHPWWYRDLTRDGRVRVQVRDRIFDATARTATGDERTRLWAVMNHLWPSYDRYQASTDRMIPVVVLEEA
jgi:deazaflavin-dependent oxidoreductase (nitroreductase family)